VILVWFGGERFRTADSSSSHSEHGVEPHESPLTMTIPLIVLAVLAAVGGLINLPVGPKLSLEHFIGQLVPAEPAATIGALTLGLFATAAALIGILIGYGAWRKTTEARNLEPTILRRAWMVDPFYARVIQKPGQMLANFSAFVIDRKVIDGAVNGSGAVTQAIGSGVRKWQTGYARQYAFTMVLGALLVLAFGLLRVWS
jgi:NADH-quinone oxidoreductase subunit L